MTKFINMIDELEVDHVAVVDQGANQHAFAPLAKALRTIEPVELAKSKAVAKFKRRVDKSLERETKRFKAVMDAIERGEPRPVGKGKKKRPLQIEELTADGQPGQTTGKQPERIGGTQKPGQYEDGNATDEPVLRKPKQRRANRDLNASNVGPGSIGPQMGSQTQRPASATKRAPETPMQKQMRLNEERLSPIASAFCAQALAKSATPGDRFAMPRNSAYDEHRARLFKGEVRAEKSGPAQPATSAAYTALMKIAQDKASADPEGRSVEIWFSKLFQSKSHEIRSLIKGMTPPTRSGSTDDDDVSAADDVEDDVDFGDADDDDLIDRVTGKPRSGRGAVGEDPC